MKGPSNAKQVRRAAQEAVQALADNNIKCCLFGSAACHIYGMQNRDPGDVDIVLLTNDGRDIEYIKQLVVSRNPTRFYLVDSVNPNATYKKLFYRLGQGRRCKIDILLPGRGSTLKIPTIHKRFVEYPEPYGDIPVMPILPLLLMKLKGWVDHQRQRERRARMKVYQDVGDINEMLEIAVNQYGVELELEGRLLSKRFVRASKRRVEAYVDKFPGSMGRWREIGFEV